MTERVVFRSGRGQVGQKLSVAVHVVAHQDSMSSPASAHHATLFRPDGERRSGAWGRRAASPRGGSVPLNTTHSSMTTNRAAPGGHAPGRLTCNRDEPTSA